MSGKNKFLTKIAAAINEHITDAQATQLLDDAETMKAITGSAMTLTPAENVKDVYDEGMHNMVPSKDDLKVGPAEAATGANAERMIGQYSDTTPQHGLAKLAEDLGKVCGDMMAVGKAQTVAINKQAELLFSLTKSLEADREVDLDRAVGVIADHAKSNVALAITKLDEAEALAAKAATAKSSKTRKNIEAMERKLTKAASELLEDVRDAVTFVGDDKLTTDFNLAAIKAEDVETVDEEEDDGDADDKKKADKKAQKAEEPKETVVAAPTADVNAALATMNDKIEKAVSGMGMLQSDLAGLFQAVSNQPKAGQPNADLFNLMKSNPQAALDKISANIEDADLEPNEYSIATNLFSKLSAANNGMMDVAVVTNMVADAPSNVRRIFANAA